MHLNEEDLILHYYGENEDERRVEQHLTGCAVCRGELARLRDVLALVDAEEIPEPAPSFERTVWTRLQPQLSRSRARWYERLWTAPPRVAWAGGIAVLVLAAFVAGRFSRVAPVAPPDARADADIADRVLVIAVVDHLDRSQMVLIELMNADVTDASTMQVDQERARDLVAANRLYRQTAVQTGDQSTIDVLDDLERVLLEIANAPADATAIDLEALRGRIESRGLLFRVRVVQSEMRERERRTALAGSTS